MPSFSYATHFWLLIELVKRAATGGVIMKIELYLSRLFLVSSDRDPLPIWNFTPAWERTGIEDSISALLLVVGAIPATLTAVCIIAIPSKSNGYLSASSFSIESTNLGRTASLPQYIAPDKDILSPIFNELISSSLIGVWTLITFSLFI